MYMPGRVPLQACDIDPDARVFLGITSLQDNFESLFDKYEPRLDTCKYVTLLVFIHLAAACVQLSLGSSHPFASRTRCSWEIFWTATSVE